MPGRRRRSGAGKQFARGCAKMRKGKWRTLVAEIEYRAWTHDGKLRHASYKGLREALDKAAIYEIDREVADRKSPLNVQRP